MRRPARARSIVFLGVLGGCAAPGVRDETEHPYEPGSSGPSERQRGAGGPMTAGSIVEQKLARLGLEIVPEEEAWVPPEERGKYVPCRVLPGFHESSPLPPHAAGYLIVGVAGEESGRREIREAIERWKPGETLDLRIRRNPYRSPDSEWWERRVRIVLPEW